MKEQKIERKRAIESPHIKTSNEVVETLKANTVEGLSSNEVSDRELLYGKNVIEEAKKQSVFVKFLLQFKDVMILVLIAAAIVSFVMAILEYGESGLKGFIEPAVIILIVVANAIIGLVQEGKAEKALEALKSLTSFKAKVIRDGAVKEIDASCLVPGDLITMEAGDFVPADARLIVSSSLKCEESALTGESVAVEKHSEYLAEEKSPIGDRKNIVFSGTSVTYGTCSAVVTSTGMNTEMGKIATLIKGEKKSGTPLQQKLAKLGTYLAIVALAACVVIFIIGLVNKLPKLEIFMTAISLAVSAIPEALPAVVTVVLSMGVQRMASRNAIIKSLPAVETLGSASVICSDKTGTLTQNKMTLVSAYCEKESVNESISDNNSLEIRNLLKYAIMCCNGNVSLKDGKTTLIGDPTETSIISAALRNGITKEELNKLSPRIKEIPFDSERKLMTSINKVDGKLYVIVKGAYDELASKCINQNLAKAKAVTEEMSSRALRVIAVAIKEISSVPENLDANLIEKDLTLLGLVGMIDPPREEAKIAVGECVRAGIKPVMITGDHIITASAIARELGILSGAEEAITGAELEKLSDEELLSRIRNISVYARVSPSDKIRIVKAWQSLGDVVAMTGDGVNDAPALKASDIGCAMGITGTDVAKGAADMTLTDDNFATIVEAVKEGRGVYDNIKKVVGFLLGTNIGEILLVLVAMIVWHESPLIAMQLLWINLVSDTLPAITLGFEKIDKDIMKNKPKPKTEGLFAHGFGIQILLQGAMFGTLSILGYFIGLNMTGTTVGARTICFLVLGISQLFHVFNMRSIHSLFSSNPFANKKLSLAALLSLALMAIVTFVPPIANVFGMAILPYYMYLIALALAFVPVVVLEIHKFISYMYRKKKQF